MTLLLLLFACQSATKDPSEVRDTTPTDDTSPETTTESSTSGSPGVLYGSTPEEAIPAPEFEVLAQDETVRTRDDLLGHPTVIWFYPAANTGG